MGFDLPNAEGVAPHATSRQVYEVFEVLRALELVRGDNVTPNPFPEPEIVEARAVSSGDAEQSAKDG